MSIHDDHRTPSPVTASRIEMDGVSELARDFDQIALVVDWLDACRKRDLAALMDLYAPDATLECACGGSAIHKGRTQLESYWQPRLAALSPAAFALEEIAPTPDGVVLDYLSYEGKPVRIRFTFTPEAKIMQTYCEPMAKKSARASGVSGPAI